jgi:hypothetical protein
VILGFCHTSVADLIDSKNSNNKNSAPSHFPGDQFGSSNSPFVIYLDQQVPLTVSQDLKGKIAQVPQLFGIIADHHGSLSSSY